MPGWGETTPTLCLPEQEQRLGIGMFCAQRWTCERKTRKEGRNRRRREAERTLLLPVRVNQRISIHPATHFLPSFSATRYRGHAPIVISRRRVKMRNVPIDTGDRRFPRSCLGLEQGEPKAMSAHPGSACSPGSPGLAGEPEPCARDCNNVNVIP